MKIFVSPVQGLTKPFSSAVDSSTRTAVVPTAITLLPSRFAAFIFSAAAGEIS